MPQTISNIYSHSVVSGAFSATFVQIYAVISSGFSESPASCPRRSDVCSSRAEKLQLCLTPSDCLCAGRAAAAGAGRRDGAHAKPAAEPGGGPRKPPGSVRGVCVSQREALPVQGRRHLHLQRGSGLLIHRLATNHSAAAAITCRSVRR